MNIPDPQAVQAAGIRQNTCMTCGAVAVFGFNTRSGMVWTCREHRADGDAVVEPPPPMTRGSAG